jgi:hypothetical protein
MHNKAIVRISKAAFVPHSAFETAHRCRYMPGLLHIPNVKQQGRKIPYSLLENIDWE